MKKKMGRPPLNNGIVWKMRSIRFPEEMLKKLEQLAEQSECSLNMKVIRLLSAQLEQEEKNLTNPNILTNPL